MADNTTLNLMSGGNVVASDDITSVHYQRIKLIHGADGVNAGDVSTANGLPVALLASTAAIGKLAANSGVDIGDVDVITMPNVVIGSGTVTTVSTVTNLSQLAGAAVPIGAGLEATAVRVTLPTDGTGVVKLGAGTAAYGKLAANSGVDIGDVDITSIAAGDNNIGNVDIVTLPAGNLGMQLMAASLSTVPASNITDATYIGDIKFGEALPAGTAAIGKLAANSGVDIGDVDITSEIPGTGATNLGKAEDAAHVSGDTGVMMLGVANEANTARAADSDYIPPAVDTEGNVRVVGNRDHDAVDAGEVVKVGQVAIAHGTNPTAVAAADRTNWYANRAGVPFVIGGHPNVLTKNLQITDADGAQTDVDIIGAIGAGTKYVITWLLVMADKANTGGVACRIGFGTANTPAADAAGVLIDSTGIPAGGGVALGNGGGILGVGADGAELRLTCADPAGGGISVTVGYYTIES